MRSFTEVIFVIQLLERRGLVVLLLLCYYRGRDNKNYYYWVVHVGSFKLVLGVFLINGDGLYHNYLSELSTKNYQKCYHSFVNVDTVVVALLLKHIHIHF